MPFEDSRRLTGFNLHFADVGAVLETVGVDVDAASIEEWRARVSRMRVALGWADGALVARVHARGASLALAAPPDQLFTATEVDEWAWTSALLVRARAQAVPAAQSAAERGAGHSTRMAGAIPPLAFAFAPGHPAAWDEESARMTLQRLAGEERNPVLAALVGAAHARGLTVLQDEDTLSIGTGSGMQAWPLAQLPDASALDWSALHDVPVALVTGSNGKTTTTRLLAACARAHGWRTAYTSTDGVFVGARAVAAGDYSGPAGARTALREREVDAAILETARGGLLRRGLAVQRADVAVVTNVSADHFGEYGVLGLDDLADVKLSIARALSDHGTLVLNADDALLVRHAARQRVRLAWFALDADAPVPVAQRARGAATCGVRGGELILDAAGRSHALGAIAAMPLTLAGAARHNIANIAAAALAAHALGIAPATIAGVLAVFGAARSDNPGRLQHWAFAGIDVFVDYAHNPDGLAALLAIATRKRGGRLGLLLGQAGNREDAEIRELAAAAAQFAPDRIWLKELPSFLRGRPQGEVSAILRAELLRAGIADERLVVEPDEVAAVQVALDWARAGDVLVLPVHGSDAKLHVAALLDARERGSSEASAATP